MPSSVTSLFWISLCGVVAPFIAGLVPRKLVPEVVLLLIGGVLIGPFGMELAATDEAVDMLRELGLGMLFLLAGYEIELKEITGRSGRRALGAWVTCFLLALATIWLIGHTDAIHAEIAVAIALTSTALGTLLPILKDAGMLTGPVGASVLRHGAFGELGPIVAMAVLLGVRGPIASLLFLAAFTLIAVLVSLPPVALSREGSWVLERIRRGAETTSQTPVRLTLLLLVSLGALTIAFDLDAVLGAFAVGFILRRALPEGDTQLESKLEGLAFGLLIPVFFITSGMAINPSAVAERPGVLAIFVTLILVVRGGPVYAEARGWRLAVEDRLDRRRALQVALLASTGLPIIVAVTSLAVDDGQMSAANASVLVAGGAITVLLFPMLAALISRDHHHTDEPSTTG